MAFEDVRHKLPDRVFHWTMAVLVIILLCTAFLPILGIKFNWVPTHWISGVLLTTAVMFHLYRALFVHGISTMLPNVNDVRATLGNGPANDVGKYDLNQKLYHWSVSLIMLAKIDTPFWDRDPSILSDWNWGVVYSLHGAASMLLIFFFILHIYFALLPEHRQLLVAMVFGKSRTDNKSETS